MISLRTLGLALTVGLGAAGVPTSLAAQRSDSLPLGLFQYDRQAPLDPRDSVLRVEGDVTVHAVSFASPKGGRVTGLLFVPTGKGPFAGVIAQHGAPGNAQGMTRIALPVAERGAVVLAMDAPWARTNTGIRLLSFTPEDSAAQVQLIVDLQRGVDFLLARKDVDPERLGYVGRSYGGAMGSLFAGVERRLKTYVLQVGDGGLVAHFTGPDDGGPPNGISADQWDRWLGAMRPIEPIRFVARAAPATLFFQSGRRDELIPIPDAETLHRAGSQPKEVRWYDTGHRLDDRAMTDMLEWLDRAIATAPRPRAS
jgi:predicted esterase